MEKSSFFNSEVVNGQYDRLYLAEDFASYFASFIGNGVFPNPSTNLQVTAEGNSMKVIVAPGKAWINGYYYINDSNLNLTLNVADGVLKRIDRVVVRLDHTARTITTKIRQGAFASNPVAPTLQRDADAYEIAIADIAVANGAISILNSNITDLRLNKNVCGVVHGTVDQVDTTTIFNTYQKYLDEKMSSNEFQAWLNGIKDKLDPNSDAAAQLLLLIQQLEKNKFGLWVGETPPTQRQEGTLYFKVTDTITYLSNAVKVSPNMGIRET